MGDGQAADRWCQRPRKPWALPGLVTTILFLSPQVAPELALRIQGTGHAHPWAALGQDPCLTSAPVCHKHPGQTGTDSGASSRCREGPERMHSAEQKRWTSTGKGVQGTDVHAGQGQAGHGVVCRDGRYIGRCEEVLKKGGCTGFTGACVAGAEQVCRTHVDRSCGVHLGRCTRGVGACRTGMDWFCSARAWQT